MTGAIIQPASPPSPSELSDPRIARTWKAAQEFEAMALGQLLSPMFETVPLAEKGFGGGAGEETWRPMMTQEIAKHIAQNGGLGLAVPVYRQMLLLQEKAAEERP